MTLVVKRAGTAEKIVSAASQLFARQGYHGSSTRQIARLAGISENTLFRHFACKEDLFWSALRSHAKGLKFRRELQEGMAQCASPHVVFPKLVEFLADTVNYRPELLRLIAVAFLELPWKADAFCEEHLTPNLSCIHAYLEANMKRGEIRELDSRLLTTAFTMSVLAHPALCKLLRGEQGRSGDRREAGRIHTKFWLDVLAPRSISTARAAIQAGGESSSSISA